jgi:hypothetical protein
MSCIIFFSCNSTGPKPNLELNLWDFGAEPDDCFLGLTLAVKPSVSNLGKNQYTSALLSFY